MRQKMRKINAEKWLIEH